MTDKVTELHKVVLRLAESNQLAQLTKLMLDLESQLARYKKLEEAAREYWSFCVATGWETSKDHYLEKALAELQEQEK